MITRQGAGAIVSREDGKVLLVRLERRGMRRWELPTAIRKGRESLLTTVFRCVEEESGFRYKVRIGRAVCLGLNISEQLGNSYFGIFFECTAEDGNARTEVPAPIGDLPPEARQTTLDIRFLDWRELPPQEMHPQHRAILEQWAASSPRGGLFSMQSDADREARYYRGVSAPASSVSRSAPEQLITESSVELKYIHVSDIHFGSNQNATQAEKRLVLAALSQDVRRAFENSPADYIFVTGDIAYSAQDHQYAESLSWLKDLALAAGVGIDRVWLVPGNHDVMRDAVRGRIKKLHFEARNSPHRLDDFVSDPVRRKMLETKLKRYSDWVAHNLTHISEPLDWSTVVTTRHSKKLLVVGLCTVWVSDQDDGKPNLAETWSNNMFVSRDRSLSALKALQEDCDITILLTHHPRNWLCLRSDNWLDTVLRGRAVVHLCGHVHVESAGVLFTLGAGGRYATIVGGAVHGGDGLRHGYSWGQLRFSDHNQRWCLGWAPRIWAQGQFTADRTNYPTLDGDGFSWQQLERIS